jgi:uncharacterized membrane protein
MNISHLFPALFEISPIVISTCSAGIVLFLIGVLGAHRDFAEARGLDRIVALGNLCFAAPLAVFGAEHLSAAQGISQGVPKFMPWPLFWTYFVGCALIAASLSIATKIQAQWSGLLFGIMMFLFVAMIDLPTALHNPHNRIFWALLAREMSFGAGGWCLASAALASATLAPAAIDRSRGPGLLVTVARIVIGIAAIFYGVEHFLHLLNVPGVPLEKIMPTWIPARPAISYVTGVFLIVGGAAMLTKKLRVAATYLGTWLFLIVLFIYGPILISSLLAPGTGVKVEGINYFFDTLLYAGTILGLASAAPHEN